MLRWLKVLPLALVIVTLIIVTSSCSTSGSSTQARFVNAIADTQAYNNSGLDVQVNGTKDFTNVTFPVPASSNYTSIPAGNDTIEGLQYNSTTEVFSNSNVNLSGGKQYTLVATGSAASTSSVVILDPADNNTAPANGSVNFRVINASSFGPSGDGGAVDVYILPTGTTTNSCSAPNCIPALAYQSTSGYMTLPYNSNGNGWQLIVTRSAGNSTPYFNFAIANFGSVSEGAICTLVLTDQQNGSAMSTLPVQLNDLNGCNP